METEDVELCFPELINSSCVKVVVNSPVTMVLFVVELGTAWSTAFLNLLIIISISHFRQLHSSTNFILLSLAISDFFICLLLYPREIIEPYTCWFWSDHLCIVFNIFAVMIVSASVGAMVLISVDRYVAICDPLHYPTRMSVKVVSVGLGLCWSCSFHFSIFYLYKNIEDPSLPKRCYGRCFHIITIILVFIDLILTFFIPIIAIVVLYMRVFMVVLSQVRAMRSHISAVTLGPSVTGNAMKSEVKAAKNLGIVVLVFLCCFTPYYVIILLWNTEKPSFVRFLGRLLLLNSCFNPLLYVLLYPWFKKAVKLIVTLQILQPGSCEANIL